MPNNQQNVFIPQRFNAGCFNLIIIGLVLFWVMALFGFGLNGDFISLTVVTVIVGGILAYTIAQRNRKKEEYARQMWAQIAWQQQEQQRQQQEQQRQMRERLEWERRERERQEQERLRQAQTLGGILALSPNDFEKLIGTLLQSLGYQNVQHVGGSGDLGVDLTAINGQGELVVVQCKRYAPSKPISSPDLQKFVGMMYVHHGASVGMFVTTSTFTKPAIDLATKHSIILIDGNRLVQLMHGR